MIRRNLRNLAVLVSISFAGVASADWLQWRGPNFNGSADVTGLPENLDAAPVWKAELPGPSGSTPIVAGERVFVSTFEANSRKLVGICIDLKTGKQLWRADIGIQTPNNRQNNLASCSPVSDGKSVIFYFGTGDLAAFDFDGKELWKRGLAKDHAAFQLLWLYASSPLLYGGKLYIPVLQRDVPSDQWRDRKPDEPAIPSYILCIDPASGKDLWKHVRPNAARIEAKESYATITPLEVAGRKQLLVAGGDCVSAHDPETGTELWRGGGWNPQKTEHWRLVPSPVAAGGNVIVCAPKKGPVLAFKPDGQGDITATHVAWSSQDTTSDAPTPLYYKDNLYVLDGDFKKGITCMDPASGKVQWFAKIDSKPVLRASPTGADGKIYCTNEAGEVFILAAADGKLLSKAALQTTGPARGSVVALNGRILVRTADRVYLFAGK